MGRIRISPCLPYQRRWQGKLGSHRNQIKTHPQHDTSRISSTRQGEQQIYFKLNNVPACPAILRTHPGVPSTDRVWLQSTAPQLGEFSSSFSSPSSLLLYHILLTSSQCAVSPILWLIPSCWHTSPSSQGQGQEAEPPQPHCRVVLQETLPGTAGAG